MNAGSLKVLVIDDQPQIRRLVTMILREMGVEQVFEARDGSEALQFLGECEDYANMIICDWNMPRMSGLDLLRQVRTVTPEFPFLMLTARGDAGSVVEARDLGVTDYVVKPFSPETLQKKIERVLSTMNELTK